MKFFLILFSVIIANALSENIEIVREVLILTDDNYKSAINNNEYLMLDFYAPWCGPCRKLTPEYYKAAEMLHEKQPEIKLAKINVDDEEKVAEEYEVRSLPTLKFLRKGKAIEYTGGRKAEQIVKWLIKKTGSPMTKLSSTEEAQSFIDANKVAIIGFFKNQESDGAQAYLNVANDLYDMAFANISDDALFSAYDAKEGTIILFKQFDEGKVVFNGELTEESIKDFIKKNSEPLLVELHLDVEGIEKIFGKNSIKDFLFLFVSKENDNFKQHAQGITDVAKEFRDRVLFMTIDIDDDEMEPLLEEVRGPEGIPKALLAHKVEHKFKLDYYKYENEGFEADNIRKFVQDYLDGKLEPYEPKNDDSDEKTDEPEHKTEKIITDEPEYKTERIIEETKEDTSEEVKEESEDSSSDSSEGEGNGSKAEKSEESQEENLTESPEEEKKAKRSYKRAIDDSKMIKKIYKAIHLSL